MAKLREFRLEGEALMLHGYLNHEQKPKYRVELLGIWDSDSLTSEQLFEFAQAMSRDVESWEGILHRFPEEQFTYGVLAEFEETWGGKPDGVRLQAAPEE